MHFSGTTLILLLLLLGLPLLGVWMFVGDLARYTEFPPQSLYIEHAPFTGWGVLVVSAFILLLFGGFFVRLVFAPRGEALASEKFRFPVWGWVGLLATAICWTLAWTRIPGFAPLQAHTFTPLWLGYIIGVNALVYKRSGRCMLTQQTGYFIKLFPLSAAFWWFFEYLNRFVQNWSYEGCDSFSPLEYFLFATLSFSTVLPATLSTRDLLLTWPRLGRAFDQWRPLPAWTTSRRGHALLLGVGSLGLLLIGVFPNQLYPLLWLAPLILMVGLRGVAGRPHVFTPARRGQWTALIAAMLGTLICGFFWELWNLHSLARWVYHVPYVQAAHLFEMPLLGYAGYLPFGWECVAIAYWFLPTPEFHHA